MTSRIAFPAAAALLLAAAAPASAQSAATSSGQALQSAQAAGGWSAWVGCWQPVGPEAPQDAMVCVVPEGSAAVRMLSLEGGEIVEQSVMHADGRARAVQDGGCTGTETATWSRDGRRVFLRTELDCDGVRRSSTGVHALVSENEWLDVQAMEIAGQHAARSVRYRAVRADQVPAAAAALLPSGRGLVLEAARLHAVAPLTVDDVVEANARVSAPVLEALIAARQAGFGLDARTLVELERRGVPASVTDMMIAVSYPQHFAVQESAYDDEQVSSLAMRPGARFPSDCRDPYTFRRLTRLECERMMRYGYGYGFGYSRFGYSPWGYDPYGWRFGSRPIVVIVQPDRDERRGGQMVPGQGYTPGTAGSSTGRAAQPRSQPQGASRPTTGAAGSPASATSGSSGSTGTSTGRRAVPRNNNSGGGGGGDQDEREQER